MTNASRYTSPTYRIVTIGIAVWMTVVVLGAFLIPVANLPILEHTARNLYFHVPMWFTMIAAFAVAAFHSGRYLGTGRIEHDIRAEQAVVVGAVFGILGLLTGMVWARFTWYVGTNLWWNFDPKQTMAAAQLLIYGAYLVLRSAVDEERRRARLAAVYNLFALITVPFLLFVLPRQMESLHPGAEGNPAFSQVTDPIMRMIFYPACIAFIALFWWIYTLRVRTRMAERRLYQSIA
ncbi:cytochrome c biogenesis protein CcsA [soil metagenome]